MLFAVFDKPSRSVKQEILFTIASTCMSKIPKDAEGEHQVPNEENASTIPRSIAGVASDLG